MCCALSFAVLSYFFLRLLCYLNANKENWESNQIVNEYNRGWDRHQDFLSIREDYGNECERKKTTTGDGKTRAKESVLLFSRFVFFT